MKAIILARVSTKEQEEGHSIAAQRSRLAEYCQRRELDVIKTFELIESSTKGSRKEFAAMLEFAKSQGETVAIVADAVDRFQRSFKESVLIDELIRKEQVQLHFLRESMVIGKGAPAFSIMQWDYAVMGAKSYVLNLSENVKRSLEYKRRNGEWGGKAPLGYLNARDENGKSTLVQDPVRAPLIRMLFEDFAMGTESISGDLVKKARKWGLTNKSRKGGYLSASQIQHILKNPFYYGEMMAKGDLRPHIYDAIIEKNLWDRCQLMMSRRKRATVARHTEKPFVFRGLLKCAVSGRVVTSDVKKGKHVYLICRDPADSARKIFVPEKDVLDQVKVVLKSIQVPKPILASLLEHLRTSHAAEQKFHDDAMLALRAELDKVEQGLSRLLDVLINQSITQSEYDKKATELKHKQTELRMRIEQHGAGRDQFRLTLESLISLASRAATIFERSKIEQRRQMIGFVFSNLALRGKKLEFSLRSPFDLMVNRRTYASWLAFLDTVRTERFDEILVLRTNLRDLVEAA